MWAYKSPRQEVSQRKFDRNFPENASRFLEEVAFGRLRTADVRIFKSSSVIIWSDPKGAELHVITEDDLNY